MNAKISVFVICVDAIIYLLLNNLYDCTFKANDNLFAKGIYLYFKKSLENGKFHNCLKLANVTPVSKSGACTSKNNYRPVSLLPTFTKNI